MTEIVRGVGAELAGVRVTRVWVDGQTGLLFENGWDFEVNVEATWTALGSKPLRLSVADPAPTSASLLSLLWSTTVAVVVDEESHSIDLTFDAGHLRVEERPRFEAWQLTGPRGEMIIATPGGGGLAIWGPRDNT